MLHYQFGDLERINPPPKADCVRAEVAKGSGIILSNEY